jgi:hypothetical protein
MLVMTYFPSHRGLRRFRPGLRYAGGWTSALEVVHSFLIVATCQVPVNATLVAAAIPMCVMLTTLIRVGKLNVHEIVVDYCIAGGTVHPPPNVARRSANVSSPVYISVQAVVVAHLWASWTGRLDKHTLLTEQTTHHSDYFGLGKVRLRPTTHQSSFLVSAHTDGLLASCAVAIACGRWSVGVRRGDDRKPPVASPHRRAPRYA